MNKIELTDQELRDISHMADAAVEDAEHYIHYMRCHGGENGTEEELADLEATLERWRALAVKFDQLYPVAGNANYLAIDREPTHD